MRIIIIEKSNLESFKNSINEYPNSEHISIEVDSHDSNRYRVKIFETSIGNHSSVIDFVDYLNSNYQFQYL